MIDKNILITLITRRLKKHNKNVSVSIRKVQKNNSTKTCVQINCDDKFISPIIYIDEYIEKGIGYTELADKVIELYEESKKDPANMLDRDVFSLDYIEKNVFLRLVKRNQPLVKEYPHNNVYGDLAVILAVSIDEDKSYIITYELISSFNQDKMFDRLYKCALSNTEKIVKIKNFSELFNIDTNSDEKTMLCVTTEKTTFGASAILLKSTLEKIRGILKSRDFIVLPSSVHEVIVIPLDVRTDIESYNKMIKEINENVVEDKDILSDHCYTFFDGYFYN